MDILNQLSDADAQALLYDWRFMARPKQLIPDGDWSTWVILAGRGFGKTRTGAETVRYAVEHLGYKRIALVAATAADARDVMVEGESGILAVSPPSNRPKYEPSKRRITWPNGAIATTYSADEPARLRGPQHDFAWCDELAAWRYIEAWDMLMFGLRLGVRPRVIVTTTPRPIPLIRDLIKETTTHVTKGTTYENRQNLAPSFFSKIVSKYEGTRLGRQELNAEILEDVPGALWTRGIIEVNRVRAIPPLQRIVVAIDPAVSATDSSDETGIVVCGIDEAGYGYTLDDCSLRGSPDTWARKAVELYNRWNADRIVAEVNNGGDMVEHTIRTVRDEQDRPIGRNLPIKQLRASRGKHTRAEPISAFYEQNRIKHVGSFPELEDQMCTWVPGEQSPDRMDALVWAFTDLMVNDSSVSYSFPEF